MRSSRFSLRNVPCVIRLEYTFRSRARRRIAQQSSGRKSGFTARKMELHDAERCGLVNHAAPHVSIELFAVRSKIERIVTVRTLQVATVRQLREQRQWTIRH